MQPLIVAEHVLLRNTFVKVSRTFLLPAFRAQRRALKA